MITRNMIGEDGMVAVWHLEEKKWLRRWPVDARELLQFGIGALEAPKAAPAPPPARPQPKPTLHSPGKE